MDDKAPDAFRTISEVADELNLPQHVLRFWETRFHDIKPLKRGGGRRYYRPSDIDLLRGIRHLLYGQGYTIKGVQRLLREEGVKFVQWVWQQDALETAHDSAEHRDPADDLAQSHQAGEKISDRAGIPLSESFASYTSPDLSGGRSEPLFNDAHSPPDVMKASHRAISLDDESKLHRVLEDLIECRHLIDAAMRES